MEYYRTSSSDLRDKYCSEEINSNSIEISQKNYKTDETPCNDIASRLHAADPNQKLDSFISDGEFSENDFLDYARQSLSSNRFSSDILMRELELYKIAKEFFPDSVSDVQDIFSGFTIQQDWGRGAYSPMPSTTLYATSLADLSQVGFPLRDSNPTNYTESNYYGFYLYGVEFDGEDIKPTNDSQHFVLMACSLAMSYASPNFILSSLRWSIFDPFKGQTKEGEETFVKRADENHARLFQEGNRIHSFEGESFSFYVDKMYEQSTAASADSTKEEIGRKLHLDIAGMRWDFEFSNNAVGYSNVLVDNNSGNNSEVRRIINKEWAKPTSVSVAYKAGEAPVNIPINEESTVFMDSGKGFFPALFCWEWSLFMGKTQDGKDIKIEVSGNWSEPNESGITLPGSVNIVVDGELKRYAGKLTYTNNPRDVSKTWMVNFKSEDGSVNLTYSTQSLHENGVHRDKQNLIVGWYDYQNTVQEATLVGNIEGDILKATGVAALEKGLAKKPAPGPYRKIDRKQSGRDQIKNIS